MVELLIRCVTFQKVFCKLWISTGSSVPYNAALCVVSFSVIQA